MTKQGLKTMFIGALLQAIASVLNILVGILGAILTFVGFIMILVGLNKAGNEHPGYKKAFKLTIWNLIISVVGAILGVVVVAVVTLLLSGNISDPDVLKARAELIGSIVSAVLNAIGVIISVFTIRTILTTTNSFVDTNTVKFGNMVWLIYLVGVVVTFVVGQIVPLFAKVDWLAYIAAVLGLAYQIVYAIYLNKAYKQVA